MIRLDSVSNVHGSQVLFVDTSMDVFGGEKVGLVSPNGDGTLAGAGEVSTVGAALRELEQAMADPERDEELGGHATASRAQQTLTDHRFAKDVMTPDVDTLSGCWNLFLTSHDREFRNRLVPTMLEIDNGELTTFCGNDNFYERERASRAAQVHSRVGTLDKVERVDPPPSDEDVARQVAPG